MISYVPKFGDTLYSDTWGGHGTELLESEGDPDTRAEFKIFSYTCYGFAVNVTITGQKWKAISTDYPAARVQIEFVGDKLDIDGDIYVDGDGNEHPVFCYGWLVKKGEMRTALSTDFKHGALLYDEDGAEHKLTWLKLKKVWITSEGKIVHQDDASCYKVDC